MKLPIQLYASIELSDGLVTGEWPEGLVTKAVFDVQLRNHDGKYYRTRISGKPIPESASDRASYSQDRYMAPGWEWSWPDKTQQAAFPQSIQELIGCHLEIEESCEFEHYGAIKAVRFFNRRDAKIPFLTCDVVVHGRAGTMRSRWFYPSNDQALHDGGWRPFVFVADNLPTVLPDH